MAEPPSFHLRLSESLQRRIKVAAAQNRRSMTAEIVDRLEQSFELDDNERAAIKKLLADAQIILDRKA